MPKVKAADKKFTGVIAGVRFENGIGETEDAKALGYFRSRGFAMDEATAPAVTSKKEKGADPDAEKS
ncbi:hypothetical protein [Paenibacillus wynnii]|uniref:Uncharacterized protein n=1 Tax=Paenibacillus wynnii TaxID=268407 RepID=A0A098MF07_9BACL|nr:hypothetical protein [Paenibacillus wynnii]KGE20623.1 hypothetical protein PWYN_15695 [Paenibacillus wynnii]KGE21116.1 hypothetical protein PWYN_03020 [Paenibacillus wynnii]